MKPIIPLDIDGVLNPCPFNAERSKDWLFEPEFRSSPESGRFLLNLSKEMGQALLDLDCHIRWLTTWILDEDQANPNIGAALGWPKLPIIPIAPHGPSDFFWKPRAIKTLLENPGPKVIWIDDDINSFLQHFQPDVLDPHKRLLTIVPESDIGLTKAHINIIKEFINE